ncbi:MAG TPA: methylated-DNA--[protein]-cysteine S-methyltransferase [Rhizobacter sp.]|nr:methylated-DNA--[protein]-cysteine S-methyltransferase [Rhizobacter sp.]
MNTTTASLYDACTAQAKFPSPLGPVLLARTPLGLAGLWFSGQKWHPQALNAPEQSDDALLRRAAVQLGEYFAGRRTQFELPLDLQGTAFQQQVWRALLRIPSGSTRSYSEIAHDVGLSQAVRAVGAAVGRNPVSLIVPCHRVIGRDGSLTGYAGGLDRKKALLQLEGIL